MFSLSRVICCLLHSCAGVLAVELFHATLKSGLNHPDLQFPLDPQSLLEMSLPFRSDRPLWPNVFELKPPTLAMFKQYQGYVHVAEKCGNECNFPHGKCLEDTAPPPTLAPTAKPVPPATAQPSLPKASAAVLAAVAQPAPWQNPFVCVCDWGWGGKTCELIDDELSRYMVSQGRAYKPRCCPVCESVSKLPETPYPWVGFSEPFAPFYSNCPKDPKNKVAINPGARESVDCFKPLNRPRPFVPLKPLNPFVAKLPTDNAQLIPDAGPIGYETNARSFDRDKKRWLRYIGPVRQPGDPEKWRAEQLWGSSLLELKPPPGYKEPLDFAEDPKGECCVYCEAPKPESPPSGPSGYTEFDIRLRQQRARRARKFGYDADARTCCVPCPFDIVQQTEFQMVNRNITILAGELEKDTAARRRQYGRCCDACASQFQVSGTEAKFSKVTLETSVLTPLEEVKTKTVNVYEPDPFKGPLEKQSAVVTQSWPMNDETS